ncbi:MAG: hypothetical protein LBD09_02095 [Treponema sp.]|jgi:hypothetical protein|nr:hypothetical protein [Treponema sp.]
MWKICVVMLLPALCLGACAGRKGGAPAAEFPAGVSGMSGAAVAAGTVGTDAGAVPVSLENLETALEELAELERSGGFVPGLGLAESNLREQAADYAGAVLAVFKELFWAHALGAGDVSAAALRSGLGKLLEPETASRFPAGGRTETAAAVKAILAFLDRRWEEAEALLSALYQKEADADGFSRWMLLVCALEKNAGGKGRSDYGAIRARYAAFPGYWYHGARAALAGQGGKALAGEYAERCINLAPSGPYAAECRGILAASMGLSPAEGPALKTRLEIEAAVSSAAARGSPELLGPLLPLAALPDNPSTLYASGAMRALAANGVFRDWFVREAGKAGGRLAERLLYISRG